MKGIVRTFTGKKIKYEIDGDFPWQDCLKELQSVKNARVALLVIPSKPQPIEMEPQTA